MTSELTKALVAFHQNVGTIHKTARSFQNQYAPLDEVLSVVTPALSKQGLTFTHRFEPQPEKDEPLLICTLHHVSGETLESRLPLVVAKGKNATQDLGSAITYLKRYTLLAMLGLVADVDTDGNLDQPPVETQQQKPPAKKTQSKPAPKAEPAKKQSPAADPPLSHDDRTLLLTMLSEQPKDKLSSIIDAFRQQFGLDPDAKISNEITTEKHGDFLRNQLS